MTEGSGGIPTEQVERVAKVIAEKHDLMWHALTDAGREHCRDVAQAAIDALQLTEERRSIECPQCNWDVLDHVHREEIRSRLVGPWSRDNRG